MHGRISRKIYAKRNPGFVYCIVDFWTVSATYLHFDTFILELDVG